MKALGEDLQKDFVANFAGTTVKILWQRPYVQEIVTARKELATKGILWASNQKTANFVRESIKQYGEILIQAE